MRNTFNSLVIAGATLMLFSTVGCGSPTNTQCPIMGGEVQSDVSVDWNGQKVLFCCPPCIDQWNSLNDEQRKEKLALAAAGDVAH